MPLKHWASIIYVADTPEELNEMVRDSIKRMRHNQSGGYRRRAYQAPSLEFYECPVFDREAMRQIQADSPTFSQPGRITRTA